MEQDNNQSAQDDKVWFDSLSGKIDTVQSTRLRSVLREVELTDAAKEDTTHDWQRLQFALRSEQSKSGGKYNSGYKYYAMAASVLVVVATASMLMPKNELPSPAPVESAVMMRGISAQVIFSKSPEKDAKQLEFELMSLGQTVTRQSEAGKIELRIKLTYPLNDKVRAALESRVIPVPDQGDLVVDFIPAIH